MVRSPSKKTSEGGGGGALVRRDVLDLMHGHSHMTIGPGGLRENVCAAEPVTAAYRSPPGHRPGPSLKRLLAVYTAESVETAHRRPPGTWKLVSCAARVSRTKTPVVQWLFWKGDK